MHNSDTFVMVNCPGHPPLSPLPHLHMASSCPFLRRYKPSLHYHSPSSDTTEGPPFELCVAMATAPLRISRSLPTIAYADVDGCQTNHRRFFFFFFFESRGPKASDQVQIIWRMCVSRTLSISSDGKADKSLI